MRHQICLLNDMPFAVAGLWRAWEEENGLRSYSFTQITINADEHPLMKRMHKPDDEKRNLVIVPEADYDAWLGCKSIELARTFLKNYPAQLMCSAEQPVPKKLSKNSTQQISLF